jgi:hypothetical protein
MAFDPNSTLGQAITSATRIAFSKGYKNEPVEGRALYKVEYVDTLTKVVDSSIMDKFARSTGLGANYATSLPTKGDQKTYTQGKITDSFEMIKEIKGFDQYDVVGGLTSAQGIGTACAKRIELDLQLNIGMGAAAAYTDMDGNSIATTAADGLAIFHAAHTVNGSSSTFANLGSTAFGQTGLEASELLFRLFINHDGQQIQRRPNVIFTTQDPTVVNLVRESNKGMNHIEDAFRGINVYQGKYDHIVMSYLDSDNLGAYDSSKDGYWGLAVRGDENLKLFVSQDPVVYPPQLVQRNRNILVQTDALYAYGVQEPSCIVLNQA